MLAQVAWYNSVLSPSLRLSYPEETLAVVVLSTPDMFEQAFLPFLEQRGCQGLSDPIDQCVKHSIASVVSQVSVYKNKLSLQIGFKSGSDWGGTDMEGGRLFQDLGAVTEKDQSPLDLRDGLMI